MASSSGNVFLYFLAIFLPPLSVFFKHGCGAEFWIDICLTILAWIPGVIYSWYVISQSEKREIGGGRRY